MHELRLVGVSQDGTQLLLAGGAQDAQYTLTIDERLASALRGDRSRLGQLQIELESTLRPREIQARIRAGESAEQVAASAGVPVERIRRFEGPVLQEREFMAGVARSAAVRTTYGGDGPVPLLGELVAERLSARGVDPVNLAWDSWRREDGRWEVRLTYQPGQPGSGDSTSALWVFDPARKVVRADDDEARWLTDEAPASTKATASRWLASVPRDGAPTSVAGNAVGGAGGNRVKEQLHEADASAEPTLVLARPGTDAPGEHHARTASTAPGSTAPGSTAQEQHAAPASPHPQEAGDSSDDASADRDESRRRIGRRARPRADRRTGETDQAAVADGVAPGKRATVPSWDEILFGSRPAGS
ncbi:MAG: septation protein SepH [Actinomycetes bacterium]